MVFWTGCNDLLNQQRDKDRGLAHMVSENLKTDPRFSEHFVSLKHTSDGVFEMEVKGFEPGMGQDCGKFAYNCMAVMEERNNTVVKSGRKSFVIKGMQNRTQIFEVTMVLGAGGRPQVTLMGIYQGETWTFGNK